MVDSTRQLVRLALISAVVSACTLDADPPGATAEDVASDGEDHELRSFQGTDCSGASLPLCPPTHTGPTCNYRCEPGAPGCGFRYYCHADGRVAGINLSRTHLFRIAPADPPGKIRNAFVSWIASHEAELGLAPGLTTSDLSIEPADNFVVNQELLRVYRFEQSYPISFVTLPASESSEEAPLPFSTLEIPVVGEGALLTIEADPTGAVSLKGTIIDPRVDYAHRDVQAKASIAAASIKAHTSARTGIPVADLDVIGLQRVAVPWAERVGWYGVPVSEVVSLARVIVDADPYELGTLDLLMYSEGKAESVHDVTPIQVRAQDPAADPWADPLVDSIESTLKDGSPLLGSLFEETMHPQLATTEVVVLDLLGNHFELLTATNFQRYTDPSGHFLAFDPTQQFRAQRVYHVSKSAYALLDRAALGAWDSALSFKLPGEVSAFPPGTFRPRVVIAHNHASIGQAGLASLSTPSEGTEQGTLEENLKGDELALRPTLADPLEPLAAIYISAFSGPIHVHLHELGHAWDFFLAPGLAEDHAGGCEGACDKACVPDTPHESRPLLETIAQMFAMWQLVALFDLEHDTCDLMQHMRGGSSLNNAIVHSPGCMTMGDQIGLFIRDDDPACPHHQVCDKPSTPETDLDIGKPWICDNTPGYNVFSVLQAWWNTLHGLYCEPTHPFSCTSKTVVWPPGCDHFGSAVECVEPHEAAGLALIYAVRTNPLTYEAFFDSMARFVACNYGYQAYVDFNQALCDHAIRPCHEDPPSSCGECGNGIREGNEQCDGDDLSVDILGYVPTCANFGYDDGILGCSASCTYDLSQCTVAATTTTGPVTASAGDTGLDQTGPGHGDEGGGGGGCDCRTTEDEPSALSMLGWLLLLAVRRRRRRASQVALATVALAGCGDDTSTIGSVSATGSSSSPSETEAGESETGVSVVGWPEDWFGEFYSADPKMVGEPVDRNTIGWYTLMQYDGVSFTRQDFALCGGEPSEQKYRTAHVDGEIHLEPFEPGDELRWGSRLERAVLKPGESCNDLKVELTYRTKPDELSIRSFTRGTLCRVATCDDTTEDRIVLFDECPDSPNRGPCEE